MSFCRLGKRKGVRMRLLPRLLSRPVASGDRARLATIAIQIARILHPSSILLAFARNRAAYTYYLCVAYYTSRLNLGAMYRDSGPHRNTRTRTASLLLALRVAV